MEQQISLNTDNKPFFDNIIYGKKDEQDKYLSAVHNFNQENQTIIYVSGKFGVGKSYFIRNINNTLKNYNILYGRFEKFKSNTPFYGITQVFNAIIQEIQDFPIERQKLWKESLNHQFSSYYSELVSVVPELDKLLTDSKDESPVRTSPILLENKINDALIQFIKFYAENLPNPTLLTFENIHWIDIDSSNLIQNILSKRYKNLLFVFSKRDHSNDNNLSSFIQSSQIAEITVDIKLKPLNFSDVSDMLDNMFNSEFQELGEFKKFCFSKSKGNIQELEILLSRLNLNRSLVFENNNWKIDFEKIKNDDSFTEESTESLFEKLAEKDKSILQISSCFGSNLNIPFIAQISELSIEDINLTYQNALNIGVIRPTFIKDNYVSDSNSLNLGPASPIFLKGEDGNSLITNFEFCNDLFQDKIKNSIEAKKNRDVHRKITNYFIESSALGLKERDVFDAVYHLNKSVYEGSSIKQKLDHIELNLKAANRARKTASNTAALTYIRECMKYNMHNNWKENYKLSSEVHVLGFEIARLVFEKDIARNLYNGVIENCKLKDINKLKLQKIIVEIQHGELEEALITGLSALKSIGIKISPKANRLTIVKEFVKTRLKMYNHNSETILELPKLIDENSKIAQEIIFWMFRSAQYINTELNGVLALKSLQITLEKGTNENSYTGFMAYGVIIGAGTNNYNSAYTYCNIGNLLAEKYHSQSGGVQFGKAIYSAFKFSLKDTLVYYKNAKALSLKTGDFLAATEPAANESLTYLGSGFTLQEVENKINENIAFCSKLNMNQFKDFQIVLKHKIRLLRGFQSSAEEMATVKFILEHTTYNFTTVTSAVLDIQRLSLSERWEEALDLAQKILKDSQVLTGLHIFTEYNFYYALSLINRLDSLTGFTKFQAKRKIKSITKNMAKWADSAPENHAHKLEFLISLYQTKNGNVPSAILIILKSAETAYDLGFIQNSALIYSNLSHLYSQLNDTSNSQLYKEKSLGHYKEWGYNEHI